MKTKLARPTIIAFVALFVLGFIAGINVYAERPATYPPNNPANNAIALHIVLAIAAVIAVVGIQAYRSRNKLPNIWLAPFSKQAFARFKATMLPKSANAANIARAILCLPFLYLILWEPFRGAMQIIAAKDPSVTANAWGGPTYWGASGAHWLDAFILFYLGAFMLNLIMRKVSSSATRR